MRFAIALFFLVSVHSFIQAQPTHLPVNSDYLNWMIGPYADTTYNFSRSFKPYHFNDVPESALRFGDHRLDSNSSRLDSWLNGSLLSSEDSALKASINPHVVAMYGYGMANDSVDESREMGLGFTMKLSYRNKLALGLTSLTTRSTYTDYVEDYIRQTDVVPGQGQVNYRDHVIQSVTYNAYLSYSPDEIFNFEVGNGKHFIGNGYRSLLLSDNSAPYPYFKIQVKIWKINYQFIRGSFVHTSPNPLDDSTKWYSGTSSNYLSVNVGKNGQIGLFQTVVWQSKDSLVDRSNEPNYWNPVAFFRPIEFSIGSPDNVILGLDWSYRILKKNLLYGQVVLDEFLLDSIQSNNGWWANKYGFQVGFRMNDLVGVKGLSAMAERNEVRPYTYSHSETQQSYGHYNQPVAHTLGANFREYLFQLKYIRNRWLTSVKLMQVKQGRDHGGVNYGRDLFKSNRNVKSVSGNFTGQGDLTTTDYFQFRIGFLINPNYKLMAEAGFTYRLATPTIATYERSTMFHIGLKTLLYNRYTDF